MSLVLGVKSSGVKPRERDSPSISLVGSVASPFSVQNQHPFRLTEEEKTIFRKLYNEGLNDKQIALQTKRCIKCVFFWRKKNGLVPHFNMLNDAQRRKLYAEGLSDKEIAQKLEVSRNAICQWRKVRKLPNNYLRKPFSKEENECRRKLYDEGFSDYAIGQKLGVLHSTIYDWRKRNRLPTHFKWHGTINEERNRQILRFYKCGKQTDEIATILGLDYKVVSTVIGFHLMKLCRKEPTCPYKALLPETNSEVSGV